jgi:hypothetical protein
MSFIPDGDDLRVICSQIAFFSEVHGENQIATSRNRLMMTAEPVSSLRTRSRLELLLELPVVLAHEFSYALNPK